MSLEPHSATDFVTARAQAGRAAAELRSTNTVRERCGQILEHIRIGHSHWFELDERRMDAAAQAVVEATRRRYPKGHIPLHSRWRHFEAGGVDRKAQLDKMLEGLPASSRAKAMIDLVVVSVLLDAGAGPDWKYTESASGQTFTRSEGLAVASFHAFTAGMFSSNKHKPLQVDAQGLRALVTDRLAQAFQVSEGNPLVGLQGRAILLRRLGEALQEQPEIFGEESRPGELFDMLIGGPDVPHTADVAAHDILSQILETMSGIWPMGSRLHGAPLGDCWRHAAARSDGPSDGWVPFHKLSQWLTYSLLEPFEWAGVNVRNIGALTALPEYRNGGLLIDSGVLRLRDAHAAQEVWHPGDEIIVEWRAATVALLDELAVNVRQQMGVDEHKLPLASMLEGGTWAAGRELAGQKRNGLPPLQVHSDGTVF